MIVYLKVEVPDGWIAAECIIKRQPDLKDEVRVAVEELTPLDKVDPTI